MMNRAYAEAGYRENMQWNTERKPRSEIAVVTLCGYLLIPQMIRIRMRMALHTMLPKGGG